MFKLRFIVVGALALLLLILVFQNSEVVAVTLLFWELEMSRVILIVLTTGAGFVGGYAVARLTSLHRAGQGEPVGRRL